MTSTRFSEALMASYACLRKGVNCLHGGHLHRADIQVGIPNMRLVVDSNGTTVYTSWERNRTQTHQWAEK